MLRRSLLIGALAGAAFLWVPQEASACILGLPCGALRDHYQSWVQQNPERVERIRMVVNHYVVPALERKCATGDYPRLCEYNPPPPNGDGRSVPEPGSLSLMAAGIVGLGLVRLRRRDEDDE